MPGTLYLIPQPLGEKDPLRSLPSRTLSVARGLEHWIVETPKVARRFLKAIDVCVPLQALHMRVLDIDTPAAELPGLLGPLVAGHDVGLTSDAGCPAVADPGGALVRLAHARGITVAPLPGPSAILLALMGAGMNGQRFAFHGYLPVEAQARCRTLRVLEDESRARDMTQIMIETPYRNHRLFEDALAVCGPGTLLSVAMDLTLPEESIATRTIAAWREIRPTLAKRPAIFLLYAGR